jgi:hypothetical protein
MSENIKSLGCNAKKINDFLLTMNKGPEFVTDTPDTYTMILIDATCSMGEFLSKAKTSVTLMYERVTEILGQD